MRNLIIEFFAGLGAVFLMLSPGFVQAQTFSIGQDEQFSCDFLDESIEIRIVGNKINAGHSVLSETTIQSASTSLIIFSNTEKTVFGTINRVTGDLNLTTVSGNQKDTKIGKCQEIGQ